MKHKFYTPRHYFVLYPSLPVLEMHAYAKALYSGWVKKKKRGEVFPRNANTEMRNFEHNLHVVERELSEWCARMELAFTLMYDPNLLNACMEDYANESFPQSTIALQHANYLFSFLGIKEPNLEILDRLMIQVLGKMVMQIGRSDYPKGFKEPKCWTREKIDEFFDLFPSEEIRLQLMLGIFQSKAIGFPYWNQRLEKFFFSKSNPHGLIDANSKHPQNLPRWKDGESWQDSLRRDDDDIEPWMR